MKTSYLRLLCRAAFVACAIFAVSACGEDEPEPPVDPDDPGQVDPDPDEPTVVDPDTPVDDPAGTVTVNILNDSEEVSLGTLNYGTIRVSIDAGNNLVAESDSYTTCQLVSVGNVAGLGNIVEIPASGWKTKAAISSGEGYVIRMDYNAHGIHYETGYARLYVVGFIEAVGGGIMGAQVKYQCPFQMPIKLSSKSVNFDSEGEGLTQTVTLLNPTVVNVEETPEWVSVRLNDLEIELTAQPNYSSRSRSGVVTLSNDEGSTQISVSQSASANPLFAGGAGSEADPYQIATAEQLDNVRLVPAACFLLTADIDLTDYIDKAGNGWLPIEDFTGTFDGAMHTIKGLWINRPATDYVGMFSRIESASVKRLHLINVDVKGHTNVGSLAGCAYNSTVSQCWVEGDISASDNYAGGLCGVGGGDGNNTEVSECVMIVNVSSSFNVACGIAYGCTVSNSYVIGNGSYYDYGYDTPPAEFTYAFGDHASNCYIIGEYSFFSRGTASFCYGSDTVTDKMTRKSTYEGWDFSKIWQIEDGVSTPTLRCFD